MTASNSASQQWTTRIERGALPLIRFMAWIALKLGRPAARLILYPICLYFLIFSDASRRASRQYLTRVLGHQPHWRDIFRHYHAFAACVLDRIYFLNDQLHLFDLHVEGEEIAIDILRRAGGCILVGAHVGSFEATRALGRRQPDLRVSLVMFEENARKVQTVLNAINPALAMDVIALGRPDSMIAVSERLERGDFVGILADRSVGGESHLRVPFLGAPAAFPLGPFQMAALLRRPVVLMLGLYRGGRRYDVFFEPLADPSNLSAGQRDAEAERTLRLYVERLEHYCRDAPFNWFNFYDFWA
ncbi:MAG TPA: hypothetical protein VMC10_11600 [Stellaceae bacterium]|nr:hypothetical protein [Stellaceae bacterium]